MKKGVELIVDEPIPGNFYWTLAKHDDPDGVPLAVDYARGPIPTHGAAMEAGIAALRRHHDERIDAAMPATHALRQATRYTDAGPATMQ